MAAFLLPLALAPIIGGAMSLAGGALSVTGGVINAGATAAGIAADMAGGVIGAVGGLMGGGQSGNVKSKAGDSYAANSPQGRMIVQAKKKQKQKESAKKGGMSLAKMKPSISGLIGGSSGSMMMPSMGDGEKTPTGLLSQILGQITTNTGLLSSMLQVLASSIAPPPPPPTDVISDAKEPKGDNEGPGRVKQVFSALGSKMKGIAGSLGGTAKFLMKGLLGVGALIAFTKYRDNITGFISRTFEMLEGFGSRFADGEDPLGGFLDSLLSTGEGSIIASLKTGLSFIIEELVYAMKLLINEFRPGTFTVGKVGYDTASDTNLANQATTVGGAQNLGNVSQGSNPFTDTLVFSDMGGSKADQIKTEEMVRGRLEMMYENVVGSEGRVRWTNIGTGFTIGGGIESLLNSDIPIADIMSSQPIIDGVVSTRADLNKGLVKAKDLGILSPAVQSQFRTNASTMSGLRQGVLDPNQKMDKFLEVRFEELKIRQKALLPVQSASASNGASMPVIVADSSQHQTNTGDTFAMATSADPNDKTFNALMDLA